MNREKNNKGGNTYEDGKIFFPSARPCAGDGVITGNECEDVCSVLQ